jgi:hypothetical protein
MTQQSTGRHVVLLRSRAKSLSVVMVMNAHIIYIDIYIYDWWCSVSKVEFESRQREKNVSKEI